MSLRENNIENEMANRRLETKKEVRGWEKSDKNTILIALLAILLIVVILIALIGPRTCARAFSFDRK